MTTLIDGLELHPVRIPMRLRFRGLSHREAVLVRGPVGWGEFSPFPEYPPDVAARWLGAAVEAATVPLPSPGRSRVEVNVTIPAVDPAIAKGLVATSGASTAKVKIGEPGDDEERDMARIEAVREALGEGGRVRADVNAAWDLDTATSRLARLEPYGLEYVEQPVATLEDMRELRRRVGIPLAADELVRNGPDPLRVVEEGAADVLVLKVQPMGGVATVLDLARRAGVPVVVSSALETSVGMYPGLLAGSLVESPYAFGLGTVSLLAGDVTTDALVPEAGSIEVRRPEPDPELLERWRPDPDVASALVDRLRVAARIAG
jgi:O-succinylbenzoate synthase